jgi:hypothetical protein
MRQRSLLLVSAVTIAIAIVVGALLHKSQTAAQPERPAGLSSHAVRPPGPADEAHLQIGSRPGAERLQHKDSSGLSPMELVRTPQV